MMTSKKLSVAVVGAGIAGTTVAHALGRAGHAVLLFDKSRGPGGRLATRRLSWVDQRGQAATTQLDHGAHGFTARSAAFLAFAESAVQAGWLAEWRPILAADSIPRTDNDIWYVPVPDIPSLFRHFLQDVPATWLTTVDTLHKGPLGWQVQAGGVRHASVFDAVVLALPPAQAAPLLHPHRLDWARHASVAPMQPCWTLMGVTDDLQPEPGWDLARPPAGLLAGVVRNDARPGRTRVSGQAHWVAHARSGWSRRHLEQPAAWVQQQMQTAVAECVGRPVDWLHCTVHRWRYALPAAWATAPAAACWWDAEQGLGVCGDFLGGCGVEGAWLSAQALAEALLQSALVGALPPPPEGDEQSNPVTFAHELPW